jgi:acetyl/propionyl-CoA carboxylase alpha subunit/NAD(P)-dependent dehydrogenase (short-subunit alcohol dehydrogenase family)
MTATQTSPAPAGEKLLGRTAFVTGGTRGIGAAICRSLASQGADVGAGYSGNTEAAEGFAQEFAKTYPDRQLTLHRGDIGSGEDCRRTVAEVIEQHGRLDILVNNAGITADRSVLKMLDDDWRRVIDVNLSGAFYLSQAALKHMLERGSGRIVMISSVIGETGNIGQSNYAAAKSGLFGLTKTLARESAMQQQRAGRIGGVGLTVNTVTPASSPPRCSPASRRRCWTASARRSRWAASASRTRSRAWCTSWPPTRRPTSPVRCGASTAGSTCSRSTARTAAPPTRTTTSRRYDVFSRLAVVNRGEPALRVVRAVRELNAEHGHDIRTIALHTDAERRATFVRAADEAVVLRPTGAGSAYLDHAALGRALQESRADAAWVGWGFVAEDPAFAELCASLGVVFVGPSPQAMRLLGDKVEAKLLAESTGVPVAPWSGGAVTTLEDGRRHAEAIGYPLIVKARSGGGGRGIRIVREAGELADALERTQVEAERTFADPVVFMERLVEGGRHIEVQVIADGHGTVWAPGVRDCSVQRRNQKLVEESSSPVLTREQDLALRDSARALVRAAGYVGAGTVEFLYQPSERLFTFLEVNTRLQVEHPVTEATTGLDLVKLQLHVADGGRLEGEPPAEHGHAIEARLNAEDAEQDFAPAPGTVELLHLPAGPGVRVDTGISVGDVIPPDYDSMVAKIIAWGRDRPEALARLRCALRETTVVLRGGTTTKTFLLDLLDRPEVVDGTADTGWLDRTGPLAPASPAQGAFVALVTVAIDVYDAEEAREREAFLASARGGRPRASHDIGRELELGYRGQPYRLSVAKIGSDRYRVGLDGRTVDVDVDRLGPLESRSHGRPRTASRSSPCRARRRTSSRSTASRTASCATRRGSCAPRRRPSSSRSAPSRAGGRGGPDDRRAREHEDGDPRAGAVRRPACASCSSRSTPRSTPAPPCCAWTAPERTPRPPPVSASPCRTTTPPRSAARAVTRSRCSPRCRRC